VRLLLLEVILDSSDSASSCCVVRLGALLRFYHITCTRTTRCQSVGSMGDGAACCKLDSCAGPGTPKPWPCQIRWVVTGDTISSLGNGVDAAASRDADAY
jgi:hypothetical protein